MYVCNECNYYILQNIILIYKLNYRSEYYHKTITKKNVLING